MPSKATITWLFNDICYLFIVCFDWKICIFQQKVARVCYILINAKVPQGYIPGPTIFLLYISDLLDDIICNIAIYADITLYSKCDQASDLWQQLELASQLESDLWDTVEWARKWLVDFNARKAQVSFDWSITQVLLMWKWMNLLLRKNYRSRCWGWLSLLNRIGAFILSLLQQ